MPLKVQIPAAWTGGLPRRIDAGQLRRGSFIGYRRKRLLPAEARAIYLSQVTIKYSGNCQGKTGGLHFFF